MRVIQQDRVKTVLIGTERIGNDISVEPIVFGAGDRVTIAEAIQLFGVEVKALVVVLQQRLNDGARRRLNAKSYLLGHDLSLLDQPSKQLLQPQSAMGHVAFGDLVTRAIQETNTVTLGGPINPHEKLK